MTMKPLELAETAKGLSRNPLGIIALFIVLIYGFASLVVGLGQGLQPSERLPLVWFLVIFPVLVLLVFAWLVSRHHAKLYAPSDFANDATFLRATRRQTEIAIALGAARARWCELDRASSLQPEDSDATARALVQAVKPQTLDVLGGKTILWADDQPDNVIYERQALEKLGMRFQLAHSTEEAVTLLNQGNIDLVISDMARGADAEAGYRLLAQVQKGFASLPYIIYSSGRTPEYMAEARRRGAFGATNRPEELFEWVLAALGVDGGPLVGP